MKTVQTMSLEGYKTMLENYQICFTNFFPQVKIRCKSTCCTINGLEIIYKDIIDVAIEDKKYFIINIKNSVYVYLPLDRSAEYRVENMNPSNNQN